MRPHPEILPNIAQHQSHSPSSALEHKDHDENSETMPCQGFKISLSQIDRRNHELKILMDNHKLLPKSNLRAHPITMGILEFYLIISKQMLKRHSFNQANIYSRQQTKLLCKYLINLKVTANKLFNKQNSLTMNFNEMTQCYFC